MALFEIGSKLGKNIVSALSSSTLRGSLALRTVTNYKFLKPFEPTHKVEYEVSKDPEEWKYVERVLPTKYVPVPEPKEQCPSGWRPQTGEHEGTRHFTRLRHHISLKWSSVPDAALSHPYYIPRNMNHMMPVHLTIRKRGQQRLTKIKRIKGDIWAMEQDLRTYIKEHSGKEVGLKIDELACTMIIRGDFVHYVTSWMQEKGF